MTFSQRILYIFGISIVSSTLHLIFQESLCVQKFGFVDAFTSFQAGNSFTSSTTTRNQRGNRKTFSANRLCSTFSNVRKGSPVRNDRKISSRTVSSAISDTVSKREEKEQVHEAIEAEDESKTINWWQQWYPVAFIDDMDPKRPMCYEILGKKFVVWSSDLKAINAKTRKGKNTEEYHCFEDKCPHRLAPLSEGRINEQGQLQCAYHGWSFRRDGSCANIPQAEPEIKTTAEMASRACSKAVPCQVKQGIIWVWPDNSPEGILKSQFPEHQPFTIPELDTKEFVKGAWVSRDLEYSYDTLVENVIDPAHVPFAHHGVQGMRSQAGPIQINVNNYTKNGIETSIPRFAGSSIDFMAPVLVLYRFTFSSLMKRSKLMALIFNIEKKLRGLPANTEPKSLLVTYCIPRAPGKARIVAMFPRNFLTWPSRPRWVDHMERNAVLDGDLVFLHGQEREMRKPGSDWEKNIDRAFYMPTKSDEFVRSFRKWLIQFAGNGPKWAPGTDTTFPPSQGFNREYIMDRYNQHTKFCSACSGALRNMQIIRKICTGYSLIAASTLLTNFMYLSKLNTMKALLQKFFITGGFKYLILSGLISFITARVCSNLERRLIFADYIHAYR